MVISLERDVDLHMAQLMPLPLIVSCFRKIQIGFTFLVPAHLVVPEKGQLNGCVYRGLYHSCTWLPVSTSVDTGMGFHTCKQAQEWNILLFLISIGYRALTIWTFNFKPLSCQNPLNKLLQVLTAN